MPKLTELADRVIDTDVLIVGSEGAGGRAAIEAAKHNQKVAIITKGKMGRCGATVLAGADFMLDSRSACDLLGLPGNREDSPEEFLKDIVGEGEYLNNQKLVELYVRDAPLRVKELVDWGMRVYELEEAHGQRYPRGVITAGSEIVLALRNEVKRYDIKIIEDVMVTDLLIREGQVVGAIGLELRTGQLVVARAKAVVLATGGWHMAYPRTTGSDELTGDGPAMAYRAGAELMDMEMVQFLPGAILSPLGWSRSIAIYVLGGGVLLNRHGERFLAKWDPEGVERPVGEWPKELASIAIMTEIREGRGSPNGGVFFSLRHLPYELIDTLELWFSQRPRKLDGIPYKELLKKLKEGHALEVSGDAAHYFMGGVKINERCETNLPGLYASGECAGGLFGSKRVSSACTEVVVEGAVAGQFAAQYARKAGTPEVDPRQVENLRHKIFAPLERKEGVKPVELRKLLHQVSAGAVGVIREGPRLEEAARELKKMRREALPQLASSAKHRNYNLEWIEALQLENMLQLVELSACSALARTESRGGHYRLDCPNTDNDHWLKNIIVKQVAGEAQLSLQPVVVTSIPLPKGVLPYKEAPRR